jgi:integrase
LKLTQQTVKAIALPEGKADHFVWCESLPGFGYRLRRGADDQINASYVAQYRYGGQSRRMLLGAASVLTAGQARAKATKVLAQVALNNDPQAAKKTRRDADQHTFRATVSDYLADKKHEVRPTTMREVTRYLTGPHFKPLHPKPLDTITRADIAKCLSRIKRDISPITAARARAALSTFFGWVLAEGRLADANNPVIGTKTSKPAPAGNRVLSDLELVAIWNACSGNTDYDRIVRLAILTGMRRQEIGGLSWREIDDETFTIPAARSKNGRPHTLPLLPAIASVLETIPRMASHDRLFGVRGKGFTSWAEGKAALDARVKKDIQQLWVLHDVRRSVATGMANLGVLPHVIELVLNHVSGFKAGVAGVYNKSMYAREVRAAMTLWHDHLRTLIERVNLQQDAA